MKLTENKFKKENNYCTNLIPRICFLKMIAIKNYFSRGCFKLPSNLSKCILCKKKYTLLEYMELSNTSPSRQIIFPFGLSYNRCLKCNEYQLIDNYTKMCKTCKMLFNFHIQKTKNKFHEFKVMKTNLFCNFQLIETSIVQYNIIYKSHISMDFNFLLTKIRNVENCKLKILNTFINDFYKMEDCLIKLMISNFIKQNNSDG